MPGWFNNETLQYEDVEWLRDGEWYVDAEGALYIVPTDNSDCEGPDNFTLDALNAHLSRNGSGLSTETLNTLRLQRVDEVLKRFDPSLGYYTHKESAMPGIFTDNPWKIENDCILNHPVTGKPVIGKRIYSSSGFLVAEVYLCDGEDLKKIQAAPELYAALVETTAALEKLAHPLGVKKAFLELNTAACARKVLAQVDGR